MRRLTLYGKPGCHLCDEARAAVAQVREEVDFELQEVDVSLDPRLFREYGERIPVLDVDGEEALELGFDASALRAVLGKSDRAQPAEPAASRQEDNRAQPAEPAASRQEDNRAQPAEPAASPKVDT